MLKKGPELLKYKEGSTAVANLVVSCLASSFKITLAQAVEIVENLKRKVAGSTTKG